MGKRKIEIDTNIFNYEAKLLFLDSIDNHSSVKAYKSLLLQISKYEKEINKDLYDMSINEAKDCIDTLTRTTLKTCSTLLSKLAYYLFWANANNMTENPELLSWIKTLRGRDIVSKVAMESQYYTKEDLYEIANRSKNYQNEALLIGLFKGIEGIEMSELRLLKKENLDLENNIVHLHGYSSVKETDKLYTRDIQLNEYEMNVFFNASKQSSYYDVKFDESDGKVIENEFPLIENEYVFRNTEPLKGKANIYDSIKRSILSDRIRNVSKITNCPLTAGNIIMSGMIYELTQLKKELNDITEDDYKTILKKYNKIINASAVSSIKEIYEYLVINEIKVAEQ